jgi:glycosyltransferase involved in cell wall biosynthesis
LHSKRIKIAHLQLLPLITGVQKVSLDELLRLDRTKFLPFVICKEAGPFTEALDQAGIQYFFIPELVREISPLKDLRALLKLIKLFREQRFDILHTHSSKTGILGRLAGRFAGISAIFHTVHGFAFPYSSSKIARSIYFMMEYIGGKLCDAVIVLNNDDKDISTKSLKIPESKIHLIPNAVEPKLFKRALNHERFEIRQEVFGLENENVVCVAMVGRLWRQKNPFCFFNAIKLLAPKLSYPVHFYFIGDGELRGELEAAIRNAELNQLITILGWRNDVPKLMSALDIFVLPSRWEGMPLAILEGMASSLPVIVSDIPGNSSIVEHGQNGFLFESENDEELAELLLKLIDDSQMRELMGHNGRQKVLQNYLIDNRVTQMSSLYVSLLAH